MGEKATRKNRLDRHGVRSVFRACMGWCSPPAHTDGDRRGGGGAVGGYVRRVGPLVRGPGLLVALVAFTGAGALGGRAGVALASGYVAFLASYCLLNFWYCRETHCIVTGVGFVPVALLGFAAAAVPGPGLWYRVNAESAAVLALLVAGCALEWAVAARTGRRILR